jgi:hypothetical protein
MAVPSCRLGRCRFARQRREHVGRHPHDPPPAAMTDKRCREGDTNSLSLPIEIGESFLLRP